MTERVNAILTFLLPASGHKKARLRAGVDKTKLKKQQQRQNQNFRVLIFLLERQRRNIQALVLDPTRNQQVRIETIYFRFLRDSVPPWCKGLVLHQITRLPFDRRDNLPTLRTFPWSFRVRYCITSSTALSCRIA